MTINYVYNDKGIADYVVIPTTIWVEIQKILHTNNIAYELPEKKDKVKFNPRDYKGLLSSLNLDIEQELLDMKNAWKKNI